MRELQQLRLNRITAIRDARREGRQPVTDPAERMRERATRLSESGAILKRLADATDPLYRSLDDAQKRRFAILTRTDGARGGWQRRGRDGGEQGMPRGHRRTDAMPSDAKQTFTRKTVDGDVFAQAFVSKTVDGVMVGRVFGTKTVDGDHDGEVWSVKPLSLIHRQGAGAGRVRRQAHGRAGDVQRKLTTTEGALSAARSRSASRRHSDVRR